MEKQFADLAKEGGEVRRVGKTKSESREGRVKFKFQNATRLRHFSWFTQKVGPRLRKLNVTPHGMVGSSGGPMKKFFVVGKGNESVGVGLDSNGNGGRQLKEGSKAQA